ncbi:hypothetical protein C8258_27300 [Nocardia sp. MDA0666]|nr:hypothetical protein C8258_27300 [Nocardia sp. MDA0666]
MQISATTAIIACGAGCQPISVNPNSPLVRDSTKPPRAAALSTAAAARMVHGPTRTSAASAKAAAAWTANDGPTYSM